MIELRHILAEATTEVLDPEKMKFRFVGIVG